MKYNYGVVERKSGVIVKAPALADIVKRDVRNGKWNIYSGGDEKHPARISYESENFTYGEHMFIGGSKREIQFFEKLISQYIKVIPRVFKEETT